MSVKFSQFTENTNPDTDDYYVGVKSSNGTNMAVKHQNLGINSGGVFLKSGKVVTGPRVNNQAWYTAAFNTSTNADVAMETFVASTTPYCYKNVRNNFIQIGSSLASYRGVLQKNLTSVGNVGTGEDDLMTYTVPASMLSVNTDKIIWEFSGYTANNANAKTLKVYAGATLLATVTLPISISPTGYFRGIVIIARTGSSTQRADGQVEYWTSSTAKSAVRVATALSLTDTSTITLKLTGDATANNDIVQWTNDIIFS